MTEYKMVGKGIIEILSEKELIEIKNDISKILDKLNGYKEKYPKLKKKDISITISLDE